MLAVQALEWPDASLPRQLRVYTDLELQDIVNTAANDPDFVAKILGAYMARLYKEKVSDATFVDALIQTQETLKILTWSNTLVVNCPQVEEAWPNMFGIYF